MFKRDNPPKGVLQPIIYIHSRQKRCTKLGYKEKIHILIDEYYLSYSRVEGIIQENFGEEG